MRRDEVIRAADEKVQTYGLTQLVQAGLIPTDGRYYPAIYYPPIPMYPKASAADLLKDVRCDPNRPASVYIHIPFCVSRCTYCHWVVHVGSSEGEIDAYLDHLVAEMDLYRRMLGIERPAPTSVLLGGGTPSILTQRQLERLLTAFADRFDLSRCTQMTCELEPTTVGGAAGLEKLRTLKDHGVHRVSLGVQSFSDRALREMGRNHSVQDAREAITQIRRAGIESLSLDLIYGYPGCTPEEWLDTLDTAFALDIDAFQLYRLRIVPHGERVGAIQQRFACTPAAFPSVHDVYVMKQLGVSVAAGQGWGERSRRVFAKGPEHNSAYLTDHTDDLGNVWGLGISSWSNLPDRFFVNTGESLEDYATLVAAGHLPIRKGKLRTEDDQRRWAAAVPLKHHGVNKQTYRAVTGAELGLAFGRKIAALKKYGLVNEDEVALVLTEKGRFLADEVVIQFYHPDYLPFPREAYADGELNPHRP